MQVRESQYGHHQIRGHHCDLGDIVAGRLHAVLDLLGSAAEQTHQKQLPRTHQRRSRWRIVSKMYLANNQLNVDGAYGA